MAVRAVVFDIGGVSEITPDLGIDRLWETRLGLPAGEMGARLHDVWLGGSLGTICLDDVHQAITDRLGLDVRPGETVFLDDTYLCVAAARQAGMHAVHYRGNAQAIEEIEQLLTTLQ